MELDSLKLTWQAIEWKPEQEKEAGEIRSLLQKQSWGPVRSMQRNMLGEMILITLVYTPAILFYLYGFGGQFHEIAGLLLLLLLFFFGYFYRKDQLLRKISCPDCALRANLERQIVRLKKYIRFYVLAGTVMIPVMGLLSWGIIHSKQPHSPGDTLYYELASIPWWRSSLVWMTGLGLLTVGIYFLNVWYVNRLYGRHIRKLQQLLDELESA